MDTLSEMPIIDIDTHYTEPRDLWTSRAPAAYKDIVLEVRADAEGVENWYIGDNWVAPLGYCVIEKDLQKRRGMLTLPRYENMTAARAEAEPRIKVMDSFGISAALLYPNVVGFGSQKLMEISSDPKLRLFLVQAYNDAIAELQGEGRGRLFPQAVLPLWDIQASLDELKRCRETLGLTGIVMSDSPEHFGQPNLADPVWARFWETCQDLELPINFHVGSGTHNKMEGYWSQGGSTYDGPDRDPYAVCYSSASMFLGNGRSIMNLILSGMLERYPRLNFVSVESGLGWVPFLIQSLEYTINELLTPEQRRARFKRSPKEQFQQQVYTSYWFESAGNVKNYLEEFGADNLMFETDFPHPQCLYPDVRGKVEETLGGFSADVQRKVLFENAARLYGIEVPG
ncbi:MAG: amidohydrolase 2 [Bradyrhizobium sp.]|nr:amidohydrolase 2 [Bradyrhizobium sp.]